MKLLFDQNISYRITKKLIEIFSGCKHISDCGLKNCTDSEIWEFARKEGFSIVTFDSDFYDLCLVSGHPPKILWIRVGNLSTNGIIELLIKNKTMIEAFLTKKEYQDLSCLEID